MVVYNIGIVGPEDLATKFKTQLEELNLLNVSINLSIVNHFEDTKKLELSFVEKCDLLCFMGPIGYEIYREEIVPRLKTIPPISLHIRYDSSALYLCLYKLLSKNQGDINLFTPFSIDLLAEKEVKVALEEIDLSPDQYLLIHGDTSYTTEHWANIHEEYYRKGKTKYAVTCLTSVAYELQKRQVPVMRIKPTYAAISMTIEILIAKLEQLISNELKTIAILVKWHEADRRPKNRYTFYKQKLKFQEAIINFCEKYEMSLTFENDFKAILYTNQSILKELTKNYKVFPFTKEIEEILGTRISIGIGVGNDAARAEIYANQALKFAESKHASTTYLAYQNGKIIGPLNSEEVEPLSFSTHLNNRHLQDIAKKTSLSAITISKLRSLIQNQEHPYITSHQIAEAFDISLRTANRILHTLESYRFAKVIGEEQPPGRGRPRKLYELKLTEE